MPDQHPSIARVTLEIAIRKEFDYTIPDEFAAQVEIGSRVKVPFGSREVLGSVTALVSDSPHSNLRPILKVIGAVPLLTPKILKLARWISDYYCCPLEVTLKAVLPEVVRKEEDGWRERLMVRPIQRVGERPELTKRQQEIFEIINPPDKSSCKNCSTNLTPPPPRSANWKRFTS